MKVNIDTRPFPPAVRADYYACLIKNELLIVDTYQGNMSVTNDLEAVLLEVFRNLVPPSMAFEDLKIRYRDTEGEWDRIIVRPLEGFDGSFTAEVVTGVDEPAPDLDLFKRHGASTVSLRQ